MAWSAAPNLACCAGDALRARTSGSTAAAAAAAAINVALPMQRTCAVAVASTSGSSCFQDNLHELRLLSPRGSRRRRMAAALRLGQPRQQVFLTAASCSAAGGYASAGHGGTGRSRGSDCDEEQYNGPDYDYYDAAASKSSSTPLLDRIHCPAHLKKLNARELAQLSDELRHETVSRVAPGAGIGHPPVPVDSSLAVVELTVALHHVFDAPRDRIVWDVGHQTIPHKILTGRRGRIHTVAQPGGLSGFTCRSESEFDAFGAGHSAAAVSAGLGMAVGRDLKGRDNHVVAVIGDGAMTAGQAFEAMSNAGYLEANMVVIFNDSRRPPDSASSSSCCLQSILGGGDGVDAPVAPPSPICPALSRLQASKPLREFREVAKNVTKQLSDTVHGLAARVDDVARGLLSGPASSFFDGLGMYYIGPVDGHNVQHLVTILSEVKATQTDGPVIIHIVTEQGRGRAAAAAEGDDDRAGASAAPVHVRNTPTAATDSGSSVTYSTLFANALADQAAADPDIVAIHAAMARGTGLDIFGARFPDRVFDVGVAEQHAVTFAAGLACEGLKPFCAISSSCLQRAYDQVFRDVAQQRLPVRFAVSDAGLAGAGALDVTYMACLPSMVVMAPADGAELARMVATAAALDDRPSCFRFPRGYASLLPSSSSPWSSSTIEVGRGRVLVEGSQVALLAYGATVPSCMAAQAVLAQQHGVSVTVADARFCKPLDRALIRRLAREHQALVTVEEGAIGGFGSHVAQFLALDGLLDGHLRWRPLLLPDSCYHLHQGSHHQQLAQAGLTVEHIAATVLTLLGKKKDALQHIFSCSSPSSSSSRF